MEAHNPFEGVRRPEFNPSHPEQLFQYAGAQQQWLRDRISIADLPSAIDHLVGALDEHALRAFEAPPRVVVTSPDVLCSGAIQHTEQGFMIPVKQLTLKADDAALFGEHTLKGVFAGFHKGQQHEVRAYVSVGDPRQRLATGVYEPFYSVPVDAATIQFEELVISERKKTLTDSINTVLRDCRELTRIEVRRIKEATVVTSLTSRERLQLLQDSESTLSSIAKDPAASYILSDALLEWIALHLDLESGLDIEASEHRRLISKNGFKDVRQTAQFRGVQAQLNLHGETVGKRLGFMFEQGDQAIIVPIQSIKALHNTDERQL